jgi:hypothetical protein
LRERAALERLQAVRVAAVTLFSRLQKLNKEATPPNWWIPSHGHDAQRIVAGGKPGANLVGSVDVVPSEFARVEENDAELIVECRNSLPAVLNLIEAAQWAREESQQLVGMDDPFGSQGPPILIGANAWFALAEAVAVFVSGQEEERRGLETGMSDQLPTSFAEWGLRHPRAASELRCVLNDYVERGEDDIEVLTAFETLANEFVSGQEEPSEGGAG